MKIRCFCSFVAVLIAIVLLSCSTGRRRDGQIRPRGSFARRENCHRHSHRRSPGLQHRRGRQALLLRFPPGPRTGPAM